MLATMSLVSSADNGGLAEIAPKVNDAKIDLSTRGEIKVTIEWAVSNDLQHNSVPRTYK